MAAESTVVGRSRVTSVWEMMPTPRLNDSERDLGRMIKLVCLVIIALAIVYVAMDRLESILIPFMLALAISYLWVYIINGETLRRLLRKYPESAAVLRKIQVRWIVRRGIVRKAEEEVRAPRRPASTRRLRCPRPRGGGDAHG